jgi:phosphomevalonate kinase
MAESAMLLTVPGNILLFGEYAVLEEGGLGLALAVERRVRVTAGPSGGLEITGTWGTGSARWAPDSGSGSPLFDAVVKEFTEWQAARSAPAVLPAARLQADSSAFFRAGSKGGFGGSAAVCVGVSCALLELAGLSGEARGTEAARLALQAHRRAQGGRGSGYDVLCSFHGGLGLFRGGNEPSWQPCRLAWEPVFFLFPGPAPVSTPDAIGRYTGWKRQDPRAARDFLRESNAGIQRLLAAPAAREAAAAMAACRELGIRLGDAIGVDARISAPPRSEASWCKAAGAGNELGILAVPRGSEPPAAAGLERVVPSPEGVTWER